MVETSSNQPPRHQSAHAAMHPAWRLRKQSAIHQGQLPWAPNLVPIAGEMCQWLQQKGHISLIMEAERGRPLSFTNPYTYSASSLAAQLASAINQTANFATSDSTVDPIEAELQRIRLESELILQLARFCEAAMKQMLYCTNFDERLYKRASMGHLLAFDCPDCRKDGKPHHVSLLGALAHHYFDCPMLESCLFDHLAFAGTRRNKHAAHSESAAPSLVSAEESRAAAKVCLDEVGQELGHMCQHIGEIERKMTAEIRLWINYFPEIPPFDHFMRIPVRVSDVLDSPDPLTPTAPSSS